MAFCRTTRGETSAPFFGPFRNSGTGSPTEFWTLNTSESPRDAVESSLSDVLVDPGNVPALYFLSRRACEGILRRAERRGRNLPPHLIEALTLAASRRR